MSGEGDKTTEERSEAASEKREAWAVELDLDLQIPSIPIIDKLFCEPFEICIPLPWGLTLCTNIDFDFPDCKAWMEKILGPLLALLGSIQPLFLVIDVVLAIQQCILAIPEAVLTLSPDPLLECIEELIAAILALLCALYPPFAWPRLVLSVIDLLLEIVQCIKGVIEVLCEVVNRIENLDNLLAGDPALCGQSGLLDMARLNVGCQINGALGGLLNLCSLIEVLNNFILIMNELAGEELMPLIPCPDFQLNIPCEEILVLLQELEDVLNAISAVIPDCPPEDFP